MKTLLVYLLFFVRFALFSTALVSLFGVASFIESGDAYAAILSLIISIITWIGFTIFVQED